MPVISIGNLTMGGTGKTPMVRYVAELLQQHGLQPVIVSRGYGGRASGPINIVSDGRQLLLSAQEAGDEPRMLAEMLPGVAVLTGQKKAGVAQFAEKQKYGDVVVLDDGFQHLALNRNVNLVLFNARKPLGNGRVFPGGDLREPFNALNRADAFILTGMEDAALERKDLKRKLQNDFPEKPVFEGYYNQSIMLVKGQEMVQAENVEQVKFLGFCGIARPEAFLDSVRREGLHLNGFKAFKDHHHYTSDDIVNLIKLAEKNAAEAFLTTDKDFVKIRNQMPVSLKLYILSRRLSVSEELDGFLQKKLQL